MRKKRDRKKIGRIFALIVVSMLVEMALSPTVTAGGVNDPWRMHGNNNADGDDYIGTTVEQPLRFKTYSDSDSSIKMIITTDGKVGIGTDNPNTKLEVLATSPQLRLSNSASVTEFFTTSEGNLIIRPSGQKIGIYVMPRNTLDIVNNMAVGESYAGRENAPEDGVIIEGNVGIGATNPRAKLELRDTSTQLKLSYDGFRYVDFQVDANHNLNIKPSAPGGIRLQPTADSVGFFRVHDADGGTPIVNIDSYHERVGIGTYGPEAKLHVEVDSGGAANIGHLNSATGLYAIAFGYLTTASESYSTAMGSYTTASGDASTALGFGATASGTGSLATGYLTTADGLYSTAMGRDISVQGTYSFGIGLNGGSWEITQDNTMAIMGGNVGIGDSSPGAHLVVGSDTNMGIADGIGDVYIQNDLEVDGNIYMGNNLVATQTWVQSQGYGDITAVGSMTSGAVFADSSASSEWLGLGSSAGRIEFDDQGANPDEVNILDAKVGIGTETPGAKLEIIDTDATSYHSGLYIEQQGGPLNSWERIYGIQVIKSGSGSGTNIGGWFSAYGAADNWALVTDQGSVGFGTYTIGPTPPKVAISDTDTSQNRKGLWINQAGAITGGTGYGLYVSKTGASNTNVAGYFSAKDATNNYGLIVADGNVDIQDDLEVGGDIYMDNNLVATQSWIQSQGYGDITAVGSMTSGAVFTDSSASGEWLGLGSSAGRIEFDNAGTNPDEVNILDANVGIGTPDPDYPLDVQTSQDYAIYGFSTDTTHGKGGIYGKSQANSGSGMHIGIQGNAIGSNTGQNIGVYGAACGAAYNYAGYFNGDVYVDGKLGIGYTQADIGTAKLAVNGPAFINGDLAVVGTVWSTELGVDGIMWAIGKLFRINHTLNESKYLQHSALEGPEWGVIYRGNGTLVNGQAIITLPDYYDSLTMNNSYTVQLTAKGNTPFTLSYDSFNETAFKVYGSVQTGEFDWEVKATRDDIDPLEVEPDKDSV